MRLYSDLIDGSGRRYYFALESAPGGIAPAPAGIVVSGLQPTIFLQSTVFRTPAPAVITISNLPFLSGPQLQPATAVISLGQLVPGLLKQQVITPAIPTPDYSTLPDNAPTILFIQTVSPAPAAIALSSLPFALGQGGNIGFVFPDVATITIVAPPLGVTYGEVGIGQLVVQGLAPTLKTELIVAPGSTVGADAEDPQPPGIIVIGYPPTLSLPFRWTDVTAPPGVVWTPITDVAA